MNPKVITPPAQVITTEDAKLALRVDAVAEDTLIDAWIESARVDAQHYAGIAIGEQTLELQLDAFPAGEVVIALPMSPIVSVTSIKYIDADGAEQTWGTSGYALDAYNARVILKYGQEWPATRNQLAAVKVQYVAGVEPAGPVYAALLLLVQAQYERGDNEPKLREAAQRLLDTVKDYR
jgi:uncharacterized phiE125 gp8 family phage protein